MHTAFSPYVPHKPVGIHSSLREGDRQNGIAVKVGDALIAIALRGRHLHIGQRCPARCAAGGRTGLATGTATAIEQHCFLRHDIP